MKYLSLFSGIGGFEKGIQDANTGWECVGFSEIDKYAKSIYSYHYPNHTDYDDVSTINVSELPNFDILVGGFPCQAFSIAGKRQGFKDTRGTLFFEIARICEAKRPEWLLLENVKGLLNHEGGKTIATIFGVLTELGYSVGWEVVNSCHFGVPQNRERIFIVGHLRKAGGRSGEILPFGENEKISNPEYSGGNQEPLPCITATEYKGPSKQRASNLVAAGTWRAHKDGEGFRELENPDISPCIPARARQDGSGQPVIKAVNTKQVGDPRYTDQCSTLGANDYKEPKKVQVGTEIRRLTPKECERLQGFPDDWTKFGIIDGKTTEISDTQRYKTLGNAVTVNVITAIASRIWQKCN